MSDCKLCLDQLLEPDPEPDFLVVNNNGSLAFFESSATPIPQGAQEVDVTFAAQKINAGYTFNELAVQNVTDGAPLDISATVTERTQAGFSVLLSGIPDTSNYVLRWEVAVTQV